jgi:DDE superfamily endonuclease
VIAPQRNAAFVACMEDLLDLYAEPYDCLRPVVCMDEMPVGVIGHFREPLPCRPGKDAKEDYSYVRKGSATVFGALDFKGGKRLLEVSEQRTSIEFAHFIRKIVDQVCPDASVVRLVLDNLSTHTKGAFYETFPPDEARRLLKKLEFHYTPKHGSWLNIVELEFAASKKQCLDRRFESIDDLRAAMAAWQDQRNEAKAGVRWTFETTHARTKLKRIYPTNEA